MKKNIIIEHIAMDMECNGTMDKVDIVSDEKIIEKIKKIEDIEQRDRDGRTLLINAAFYGRKNIIKYLLERRVNVDAEDAEGFTALHAAVITGDLDSVQLLLENGAEVNAQNMYGNTPIMLASQLVPIEMFRILLRHGANPSIKNYYDISTFDLFEAYPKS